MAKFINTKPKLFLHQPNTFTGEGNGTPLQYSCLEIPWTDEPRGLQSMGSLRVGHDWATSLSLFTFMHWRRKWQPTPVFLPGVGEPGGLPSTGSHRVGHDWSDLAAAEYFYTNWMWTIIFKAENRPDCGSPARGISKVLRNREIDNFV